MKPGWGSVELLCNFNEQILTLTSHSFTSGLRNRSFLASSSGKPLNTSFMRTVLETSVYSFHLQAAGKWESPTTSLMPLQMRQGST